MLLKIHPENPELRKIKQVVDCLKNGGIIIYPTDTIYGMGCDIYNHKAVEKLCRLKEANPKKVNLSFVCHNLSHLSEFTIPFDRSIYKLMHKNLPGPFTFILKANNTVPKLFKNNKKTVGIRVPDNNIARNIVAHLGNPIVSTSLKHTDDILTYMTDPELIYERYQKQVDLVIDGGFGNNLASTVVDCTQGSEWEVLREGAGILQ